MATLTFVPEAGRRGQAPGGALARELRQAIQGEVRFDQGSRALYATDASNYRQVPFGVVIPRSKEDVIRTVEVCRKHGAPVLPRGGGTSLCGQCCNVAVVLDFSKYLNRVLAIDPVAKTARVEPGVVLDDLRAAAGAPTTPPDARHLSLMSDLAGRILPLALAVAGRAHDGRTARLVLTGDGGGEWLVPMGDGDPTAIADGSVTADVTVTADVLDWCQLVGDRVAVDDLVFETEGDELLARDLVAAAPALATL